MRSGQHIGGGTPGVNRRETTFGPEMVGSKEGRALTRVTRHLAAKRYAIYRLTINSSPAISNFDKRFEAGFDYDQGGDLGVAGSQLAELDHGGAVRPAAGNSPSDK